MCFATAFAGPDYAFLVDDASVTVAGRDQDVDDGHRRDVAETKVVPTPFGFATVTAGRTNVDYRDVLKVMQELEEPVTEEHRPGKSRPLFRWAATMDRPGDMKVWQAGFHDGEPFANCFQLDGEIRLGPPGGTFGPVVGDADETRAIRNGLVSDVLEAGPTFREKIAALLPWYGEAARVKPHLSGKVIIGCVRSDGTKDRRAADVRPVEASA